MRIKTYSAASVPEAMARVRAELGDDAFIVSTVRSRSGSGVEITAAIEMPDAEPDLPVFEPGIAPPPPPRPERADPGEAVERLARTLAWHGLPPDLTERIAVAAARRRLDDPAQALAAGLTAHLRCSPIALQPAQPIMLVGTAGVGKSTSAAKLAARAVMAGVPTMLISCDTARAGATAELQALAAAMELPVRRADSAGDLHTLLDQTAGDRAVFIDMPGLNPYDGEDMAELARYAVPGIEPVLVVAAGGDAAEQQDHAAAFARLGAKRLIATRLDAARRLGGILAAADAARLDLADFGFTPLVAHGLAPVDAQLLARLLLRDPAQGEIASLFLNSAAE